MVVPDVIEMVKNQRTQGNNALTKLRAEHGLSSDFADLCESVRSRISSSDETEEFSGVFVFPVQGKLFHIGDEFIMDGFHVNVNCRRREWGDGGFCEFKVEILPWIL